MNYSPLIVMWDEDGYKGGNRIPMLWAGAMAAPKSTVTTTVNHGSALRTLLRICTGCL